MSKNRFHLLRQDLYTLYKDFLLSTLKKKILQNLTRITFNFSFTLLEKLGLQNYLEKQKENPAFVKELFTRKEEYPPTKPSSLNFHN